MATMLYSLPIIALIFSSFGELCAANAQPEAIETRLTRIETVLENVMVRNVYLEERIAALENENKELRELVLDTDKKAADSKDNAKSDNLMPAKYQKPHKHGRISVHKGVPTLNMPVKTRRQLNAATVAFTAVVSPPSINVGPGQTVVYDSVVTNVGGAYDSTTGIFTAPVSGVYVFNFAEMIDPGKNEYLELVKDGVHVMWNYGHAYGANHLVSSSRTATVEVNKGSQVWVQTQNNGAHGTGLIHGNSFTTFGGWILAVTE